MIFGGLCVFALGWGGGLLLGAFNEKDAEPAASRPQVVDADAFSPEKGSEAAASPEGKSSSLLEQVFGLDDLEEERASAPDPSKGVDRGATPSSRDSAAPSVVLKEDPPSAGEAPTETVQLEETSPAAERAAGTDDGGVPSAPVEGSPVDAKPERSVLPENPYQ